MSGAAPTAARPRSPTIPAATVTARSARERRGQPGWRRAARSRRRLPTSTLSSRCRLGSGLSPTRVSHECAIGSSTVANAAVCAILFRAAPRRAAPRHLGAEIGVVAVPRTWGQAMQHHPHVHCIVPGGGLSPDRARRIACPPVFFLSLKMLGRLFRRLFLVRLTAAFADGEPRPFRELAPLAEPDSFAAHCAALRRIDWVVYAKPAFDGTEQVLAYLGRYTHRVAMTDEAAIVLRKGCRQEDRRKVTTLEPAEFIRRFLPHVLPSGFHRILHFGFLANGHRAARFPLCRRLRAQPVTGRYGERGTGSGSRRGACDPEPDVRTRRGGRALVLSPLPRAPPNSASVRR